MPEQAKTVWIKLPSRMVFVSQSYKERFIRRLKRKLVGQIVAKGSVLYPGGTACSIIKTEPEGEVQITEKTSIII